MADPGPSSLPPSYFDGVYAANDDPWEFATSAYEAEKYDATIEMLGPARYRRAFEIGCSVGVLTRRIADRCDRLVAVDVSEKALAFARARCHDVASVSFERMVVPREMPAGLFDLVVVSEVGYYWSDDDLRLAIDSIASYEAGTTIALVHFLPRVEAYVRSGDAVHAAFLADVRFTCERGLRRERYRIDILTVRRKLTSLS